jgi:hypothetical protein
MELDVYLKAVAGVTLLFVVFGAVEIMKRLKARDGTPLVGGNALLLLSLAWGVLVGAGYWLAQEPPPPGFVWKYWFGLIAYGLGLGYLASLFFDAVKTLVDKAIARLAGGGLFIWTPPPAGSVPPTPPQERT